MRSSKPWTKEEDDILRGAVTEYGMKINQYPSTGSLGSSATIQIAENEPINWNEIANHLDGRNNKDCRKRWVYSSAPSISKGPWDNTEDALLREGVQLHGTRFVSHQTRSKSSIFVWRLTRYIHPGGLMSLASSVRGRQIVCLVCLMHASRLRT